MKDERDAPYADRGRASSGWSRSRSGIRRRARPLTADRLPAVRAPRTASARRGHSCAGSRRPSCRLRRRRGRAPGLYQIAAGARIDDAVRAAGGLRGDADPAGVNLAAHASDGDEIVVPVLGQSTRRAPAPSGRERSRARSARVARNRRREHGAGARRLRRFPASARPSPRASSKFANATARLRPLTSCSTSRA